MMNWTGGSVVGAVVALPDPRARAGGGPGRS